MMEQGRDGEYPDVDLLVASLLSDGQDVSTYFEVLSTKLKGALGDRVRIERHGVVFRRSGRASRLTLSLGESELSAALVNGTAVCTVRQVVKGITLRTQEVDFPVWLHQMVELLTDEAKRSEATRLALESLLT
jgi:hypothetical protein